MTLALVILVGKMQSVEPLEKLQLVSVWRVSLAHHPLAALSAQSILNVPTLLLALIQSVETHVQDLAVKMQSAMSLTTTQFANVWWIL